MLATEPVTDPAPARLLAAAGRLFAAHGFDGVKTRHLAREAGVNIAAINYYFQGKEGLYRHTVLGAHRAATSRLMALLDDESLGAEERLKRFVHGFVSATLDGSSYGMRLMAREQIQPTAALDDVVNHSIRPICERMHRIIAAIIGGEVEEERLRHAAMSVIAQCLYWLNHRPVIERLTPQERFDPERISADILRFSLVGLRGLRTASAGA